ncbi:MAG TPA: hypothetical protein ENK57_02575 [Polyangiaceae bacterium]|nr:hypothetical protein [Polyangiaceae bacterium]
MSYRVFHYDAARDVQVAADGAEERECEEILALMDDVLVEPGSFVGVVAEDGSMLTFVVLDEGIQLDIPQPRRRGSYFKMASLAVCKNVFEAAESGFDHEKVDGLEFERW